MCACSAIMFRVCVWRREKMIAQKTYLKLFDDVEEEEEEEDEVC